MPAEYKVHVDWSGNGAFTDFGEDVTGRVLDDKTPIAMQYGRDQVRAFSPISPGTAEFELNNASRDYSPDNAASPLAGLVLPGRAARVQATFQGVTTALYQGKIDDLDNNPGYDDQSLSVTCVDALGVLNRAKVTTGMCQGIRPGAAIGLILDAVGWPDSLRDLDVGASVLPFWWLDKTPAFDAIKDILASEGPPSLITVDSAGKIVFRDRHHRLQRAGSLTAQSTWRSGGVEPCYSEPTTYNNGFQEIVNSVEFEVDVRKRSAERVAVWSTESDIFVSDEVRRIYITGSAPFMSASVPIAGIDYDLAYGNPILSLNRTSGSSIILSIDPAGSPCYFRSLQVRAYTVDTVNTVKVLLEDANSIAKYGRRSIPDLQVPVWAGLADATAIGRIILAYRSDRVFTLAATMGGTDVRLTQQLTRNLSDRVRIIDSHTGLDADCFVEQIAHTITQGGLEHRTVFGLEKAPTQVQGVFILGSATNGVLGQNRLGRRGLMDPSNVFTLGSPTNGVLGSSVLAL